MSSFEWWFASSIGAGLPAKFSLWQSHRCPRDMYVTVGWFNTTTKFIHNATSYRSSSFTPRFKEGGQVPSCCSRQSPQNWRCRSCHQPLPGGLCCPSSVPPPPGRWTILMATCYFLERSRANDEELVEAYRYQQKLLSADEGMFPNWVFVVLSSHTLHIKEQNLHGLLLPWQGCLHPSKKTSEGWMTKLPSCNEIWIRSTRRWPGLMTRWLGLMRGWLGLRRRWRSWMIRWLGWRILW